MLSEIRSLGASTSRAEVPAACRRFMSSVKNRLAVSSDSEAEENPLVEFSFRKKGDNTLGTWLSSRSGGTGRKPARRAPQKRAIVVSSESSSDDESDTETNVMLHTRAVDQILRTCEVRGGSVPSYSWLTVTHSVWLRAWHNASGN